MNIEVEAKNRGVQSYAKALRSCTDLIKARELHSRLERSSYRDNIFLCNLVIEMYGKCGSLEDARKAFDQIRTPNGFTWSMMVTAYAQNGHLSLARSTFEQIPKKDVVAWNTMIAAYTRSGYLAEAETLFNQTPDKDSVSWNTMLAAYAQEGNLDLALRFFKDIPVKNVVSWNTLLVAYRQSGRGKDVLFPLGLMDQEGFQPSQTTFTVAIDACASQGALAPGVIIHMQVVSIGLESDVSIGTALIKLYGTCGRAEQAVEVFERMPVKNSITWNTMVAKLAENGHLVEACGLYERIPAVGVVSGNALIAAFGREGEISQAETLFKRMPERNVVTWTTMVAALAQNGQGVESVSCFKRMDLEGIQPDRVSFTTVIEACGAAGAIEDGKQVEKIVPGGLRHDDELGTALVNMYARCGSLENAKRVFHECVTLTGGGSARLWNSILAASSRDGNGMVLFRRMLLEGIQLDETTLVNLCEACVAGGRLSETKTIFGTIFESEFACTSPVVGTAVINMYGKLGSFERARNSFNKLMSKNVASWTVMLTISAQLGHPEEALAFFQKMNLEGIRPDEMAITSLLSACSHAGLFSDCSNWFGTMKWDFNVEPNIDHYVCVVDMLGRTGQVREAEFLMSQMPFEANQVAWTALLGACRQSGDIAKGASAAQHAFDSDPLNSNMVV